ncbi:YlxR family protein [Gordonia sp. NPDC003376]
MVQRKSSAPSTDGGRRDRRRAVRQGSARVGRHRPIRMCVGCRQRADTSDLIRVVARAGEDGQCVVVDLAKTMSGRGAWLHPRRDCVSVAVRRRAFAAALRTPRLVVEPDDLTEVIGTGVPAPATDDSTGPDNGPEQVAEDMSTP